MASDTAAVAAAAAARIEDTSLSIPSPPSPRTAAATAAETAADAAALGQTLGTYPAVHVRGLAADVGDGELRAAFARYGAVREAAVVRDARTGASRGYAFVRYAALGAARAAAAAGTAPPGVRGAAGPATVALADPKNVVHCRRIPAALGEDAVRAALERITRLRVYRFVLHTHPSGRSMGYGWARFADHRAALLAIERLRDVPFPSGCGCDSEHGGDSGHDLDGEDSSKINNIETTSSSTTKTSPKTTTPTKDDDKKDTKEKEYKKEKDQEQDQEQDRSQTQTRSQDHNPKQERPLLVSLAEPRVAPLEAMESVRALYVRGLAPDAEPGAVRAALGGAAVERVFLPRARGSRTGRGTAVVHYRTRSDAARALAQLDGATVLGRRVHAEWWLPPEACRSHAAKTRLLAQQQQKQQSDKAEEEEKQKREHEIPQQWQQQWPQQQWAQQAPPFPLCPVVYPVFVPALPGTPGRRRRGRGLVPAAPGGALCFVPCPVAPAPSGPLQQQRKPGRRRGKKTAHAPSQL